MSIKNGNDLYCFLCISVKDYILFGENIFPDILPFIIIAEFSD